MQCRIVQELLRAQRDQVALRREQVVDLVAIHRILLVEELRRECENATDKNSVRQPKGREGTSFELALVRLRV